MDHKNVFGESKGTSNKFPCREKISSSMLNCKFCLSYHGDKSVTKIG